MLTLSDLLRGTVCSYQMWAENKPSVLCNIAMEVKFTSNMLCSVIQYINIFFLKKSHDGLLCFVIKMLILIVLTLFF